MDRILKKEAGGPQHLRGEVSVAISDGYSIIQNRSICFDYFRAAPISVKESLVEEYKLRFSYSLCNQRECSYGKEYEDLKIMFIFGNSKFEVELRNFYYVD